MSEAILAIGCEHAPKSLHDIDTMDEYIRSHGKILARKAIDALVPLHVPERDQLPDMGEFLREPFEPQKHVVAASTKMLDEQGAGFVVGEMGCGKTLIGMCAIHKHPKGQPYRSIVLCPDHLIAVWVEEITETIPGAIIRRFDSWKEFTAFIGHGRRVRKDIVQARDEDGQPTRTVTTWRGRWPKPEGPEWYIVGRNQAKWNPDWIGVGEPRRGFDGKPTAGHSHKHVAVSHEPVVDELGRPVCDRLGRQKQKAITAKVFVCPQCGTIPRDKKGVPLGASHLAKEQRQCEGTILRHYPPAEKRQSGCLRAVASGKVGKKDLKTGPYIMEPQPCGEKLYNYISKPYRWAPARIIQKKLRRFFKYLIIDEVHEQKSDESAQSMAAGKLMAATDHVLALTGTLIGGYANHLYPLMIRMTPETLRAEGFEWGKDLAFSQVYGRIDRIITTKMDGDAGTSVGKSVKSMRRARTGKTSERQSVRPGVMPSLFGRHMIGSSLFITLEELAEELPDLFEYVGGPLPLPPRPEDFADPKLSAADNQERYGSAKDYYGRMSRGWIDTACDMDPDVAQEYARVEKILSDASKELLKRGSMKLLGTTLYTLLDYPDKPFGWGHDPDFLKGVQAAINDGLPEADAAALEASSHTVGYWEKPKDRSMENWRGVVTPASMDEATVRPKERKLIDICKAEHKDGKQVWVYCQMTGKRNVMLRLQKLLQAEGLRVGVLRADTVDPKERKEWIDRNGPSYDVILSHPKLVSTGLTLFSKEQGGHNFSTLVFYETGYNLFDMRQAARRAWRIGQPHDCKVYYLYYRNTMQHRAMQLMSRKMAAATALEGEFSTEGLVAMAGEDNAQMALARSLSERIDDGDMQRSWGKVKSGTKKLKRPTEALAVLTTEEPVLDTLDTLPMAAQLAAATILDNQEYDTQEGAHKSFAAAVKAGDDETAHLAYSAMMGVPEQSVRVLPSGREVVVTEIHYPAPAPTPDDVPDMSTFGIGAGAVADEPEPEDEDEEPDTIPMLTREQLAKMFQNLMDNGMSLDDF